MSTYSILIVMIIKIIVMIFVIVMIELLIIIEIIMVMKTIMTMILKRKFILILQPASQPVETVTKTKLQLNILSLMLPPLLLLIH